MTRYLFKKRKILNYSKYYRERERVNELIYEQEEGDKKNVQQILLDRIV